jgi:ubiquinone/menaquinone biosynthesis C-methylase UbiE
VNRLEEEYTKLAPHYDRKWWFYVDASTSRTIARVGRGISGRLLDVGCGTGVLLEKVAQTRPELELFGIDPVPAMIEQAKQKLNGRATLQIGAAEAIPFGDGFFDVVVSSNVFHFIREPKRALREIKRVLAPRGFLVVTDWCDDYLACRICDRLLRIFGGSHFRVYGEKECLGLLHEAEFQNVDSERFKIGLLWGLMTATAQVA